MVKKGSRLKSISHSMQIFKYRICSSEIERRPFPASESLQVKETEQTLRDRVIHLVADFRLEYVSSHLKELNERLLQVKDSQEMQEIMSEIMRTQNLRNELAKKTGTNILV